MTLRAEITGSLTHDGFGDGGVAVNAGLIFPAIDFESLIKIAALAIDIEKIFQRGAPAQNRLS